MYRPRAFGRNACSACGSARRSSSRTSAPTSKLAGPMPGPSQARSEAGAGRAPAPSPRSPRRPDRASRHGLRPHRRPNRTPAARASSPRSRMAQTRPGRRVQEASAARVRRHRCAVTRCAERPIQVEDVGAVLLRQPHGLRRQFSQRRASGGDSRRPPRRYHRHGRPRLSDSKGAALTPPPRWVESARTSGGAGQSGHESR